jgi:hypothetical protein
MPVVPTLLMTRKKTNNTALSTFVRDHEEEIMKNETISVPLELSRITALY